MTTTELTKREQEALMLILRGLSNKQVASTLYISVKTAEKHRHAIYVKVLGNTCYHCVPNLIKRSLQNGIVTLTDYLLLPVV